MSSDAAAGESGEGTTENRGQCTKQLIAAVVGTFLLASALHAANTEGGGGVPILAQDGQGMTGKLDPIRNELYSSVSMSVADVISVGEGLVVAEMTVPSATPNQNVATLKVGNLQTGALQVLTTTEEYPLRLIDTGYAGQGVFYIETFHPGPKP